MVFIYLFLIKVKDPSYLIYKHPQPLHLLKCDWIIVTAGGGATTTTGNMASLLSAPLSFFVLF